MKTRCPGFKFTFASLMSIKVKPKRAELKDESSRITKSSLLGSKIRKTFLELEDQTTRAAEALSSSGK